jgi:hypothetical protein
MSQYARTAALFAVLLFGAFGTGLAEGDWLLWEHDRTVRRLASFDVESDCRSAALVEAQSRYASEAGRRQDHPGAVELRGTEVSVPVEFGTHSIRYECLPDWFDPRTGRYIRPPG